MKSKAGNSEVIETKSAFISRVDDKTLRVILKPKALVTMAEYNTFEGKYYELMGREGRFKFLVIVQEGARIDKSYADYFRYDYKTKYKYAEAYLVASPLARMFLKILIKVVDNKFPVRLFNTEDDAILWLKSLD